MKPFVAIGRVLDEVSDVVQHLHSVDDCAKTENLYSAFFGGMGNTVVGEHGWGTRRRVFVTFSRTVAERKKVSYV